MNALNIWKVVKQHISEVLAACLELTDFAILLCCSGT